MNFYNSFNEMYSAQVNNNKSGVFNGSEFRKLNTEPIEIEYSFPEDVEENDEGNDLVPGFSFAGNWYSLDNFVRCDNPHWGLNDSSIPSYIHIYDATATWRPLFVSVSDDGAFVDVYERVE